MHGPARNLFARYAAIFALVALSHAALLCLPYYWDEGGYYIPAALDFYHRWVLIPEFTNAHPPLPNVVLGLLWHVTGYHVLATRLCVCAFAAAGLLAIFTLVESFATTLTAAVATLLVAVYPIWFAQSSLAHADIFAAAFSLWAVTLYLLSARSARPSLMSPAHCHLDRSETASPSRAAERPAVLIATLLTLAVLSKETAIIIPATLFVVEATRRLFAASPGGPSVPAALSPGRVGRHWIARRPRTSPGGPSVPAALSPERVGMHWLAAFAFPILPLSAWYAYHHHATGFTFGNPEYLRYNATANFTRAHILLSLKYRAMHLVWQRNLWVALTLTLVTLLLPRRENIRRTPPLLYITIAALALSNWLFFSVLGGALLTRYLLPVYALVIAACVLIWHERTRFWLVPSAITAAAFVTALFVNGPHAMAPEDNLTYRDMIVVHQRAIDYLVSHDPDAHVLTAWPVAADLVRPDMAYTSHIFHTTSIDNFTRPEIAKAAARPASYNTVLAFATKYEPPAVLAELAHSTDTTRIAVYEAQRDMTPAEIAAALHCPVAFETHIGGEWSAVLQCPRTNTAQPALAPLLHSPQSHP